MGRLQSTEGLSDEQREILRTVRAFVDERILRSPPSWNTATSTPRRSSRACGRWASSA